MGGNRLDPSHIPLPEKKAEKTEKPERRTLENELTSISVEIAKSAGEYLARQKEDLKEQKSTDRPPRFTSSTFGKPEFYDSSPVGAEVSQEVSNVVKYPDGSYSIADDWQNGQQSTRYFNKDTTLDKTITNFEPGDDHLWRLTHYEDPNKHGGRINEAEFENRPDGMTQEIEYDPKEANTIGLGPVRYIRSYEPDKHNGVAREVVMEDGTIQRFDSDGNEIRKK